MHNSLRAAVPFIVGVFLAAPASATVFQADYHDAGVWSIYDDASQTYSMKFTTGSTDGFWLVVSDGENPKTNVQEYAILYGDPSANRLTAYAYDGENSTSSYRTSDFLGVYENAFKDMGGGMLAFDLDVSEINAAYSTPEWDGIQLGDRAGIWFHMSEGSSFTYAADGSLLDYSFTAQSWLDRAFDYSWVYDSPDCSDPALDPMIARRCDATEFHVASASSGGTAQGGGPIPVPGGLAFVVLALALFGLVRVRPA